MKKVRYLMRRIRKLDYLKLFKTVSLIHKKSGKNSVFIFFDIIYCGFKYGAGFNDYRLNEFYNLNSAQRATYVTRGINNQLVTLLNDKEYFLQVEDKILFNTNFKKFIGRTWLDISASNYEEFESFIKGKTAIISKPVSATCGVGVEKHVVADYAKSKSLYQHLKDNGNSLIEDYIVQHKDISRIYPRSVNSIRIVSVLTEGTAHFIYAFIRIGNGERVVDNINAGGMTAPIDLDSGVILYAAFDKDSIFYEKHPVTNVTIAGIIIPFWEESLNMCREAALLVPQLGYIGWDIAVTENGPLLIEANHFPGHDILQMPPHVPDKIGMLPRFRMFVKGI